MIFHWDVAKMSEQDTATPPRNRFARSFLREKIPVSKWVRNRILGLGAINFYLFVILTVTGTLLMVYYVPSTTQAYNDIKDLGTVVSFGLIIRNMHRWSAFLMIISGFLHMSRVFYTAEYREPREFNWLIGLSLFLMILVTAYTGYTLPWDQKSYWGLTIMSEIVAAVPVIGSKLQYLVLGGAEVGQNTLTRTFVMHVKLLPLLMSLLMAVHFWRIWKDDQIIEARAGKDLGETQNQWEESPVTWRYIMTRETSKFLLVLLFVLGLSILFNAPLEEQANPQITPDPVKAPWFFVGLQEMLSWGAPFWTGIVAPVLTIVVLAVFPYFDHDREGIGVWFHPHNRLKNILFTAAVTILIGLIVIGEFMRGPNWLFYWPWQQWPVN
jgi:quinol-cytochrome oxidoreductase complex cytochrome b subunit